MINSAAMRAQFLQVLSCQLSSRTVLKDVGQNHRPHRAILLSEGPVVHIQVTKGYGSWCRLVLYLRVQLLLDLCVPLWNLIWFCHPNKQGSLSSVCSHWWFLDGGTSYQILSEQGHV